MKIYLVRHGAKENSGFEGVLTEEGKEQVKKLAETFSNTSARIIYSSANPRSYQTAQIMSEITGLPLKQVNNIREIERETFFNSPVPKEEKENLDNLNRFLKEIVKKEEDCILAMHAGVNRAVISTLLDIPLEKTALFMQYAANITELECRDINGKNRWCINLLNDTSHLK